MQISLFTEKLGCKWQAIYMMESLLTRGIGFNYHVFGHSVVQRIEQDMKEAEVRDTHNTGINSLTLLRTQSLLDQMNQHIKTCTNLVISLWKELLEEDIQSLKVERFGSDIQKSFGFAKETYEAIIAIDQNHIHAMLSFGSFLYKVINEDEESAKILHKVKNLGGELELLSQQASGLGSGDNISKKNKLNPCIIVASGSNQNMGIIKSVNSESSRIIGWSPDEIQGKPLEMIMPKIYGDHHKT